MGEVSDGVHALKIQYDGECVKKNLIKNTICSSSEEHIPQNSA